MTAQHTIARAKTRACAHASGWPERLFGLGLIAAAAALSSLVGVSAAHADGWTSVAMDPHGYNEERRSKRSASGYSSAPEVAPRQRRSKAARITRSDDDGDSTPKARRTRTAKLKTNDDNDSGGYSAKPKVSGGHVSWVASGGCLPGQLKSVIAETAQYGRVVVSSTGRGHSHNARVGGARGSYHLSCQAADFRVHGANVASVAAFLRNHGSVGGFHHYGGGLFHIDTGPKRTW